MEKKKKKLNSWEAAQHMVEYIQEGDLWNCGKLLEGGLDPNQTSWVLSWMDYGEFQWIKGEFVPVVRKNRQWRCILAVLFLLTVYFGKLLELLPVTMVNQLYLQTPMGQGVAAAMLLILVAFLGELVPAYGPMGSPFLFMALEFNQVEIVQLLLRKNARVTGYSYQFDMTCVKKAHSIGIKLFPPSPH